MHTRNLSEHSTMSETAATAAPAAAPKAVSKFEATFADASIVNAAATFADAIAANAAAPKTAAEPPKKQKIGSTVFLWMALMFHQATHFNKHYCEFAKTFLETYSVEHGGYANIKDFFATFAKLVGPEYDYTGMPDKECRVFIHSFVAFLDTVFVKKMDEQYK